MTAVAVLVLALVHVDADVLPLVGRSLVQFLHPRGALALVTTLEVVAEVRAASVLVRALVLVDAGVVVGVEVEAGRAVADVRPVAVGAEVGAAGVRAALVDVKARVVVRRYLEAFVANALVRTGDVDAVMLALGQLQLALVHVSAVEVILELVPRQTGARKGTLCVGTLLPGKVTCWERHLQKQHVF